MRFLELLNRFVSVIIVSVALTSALQFSGVASHAKDSADYNAMAAGNSDYASDVIDGIFNVSWYRVGLRRAVRGGVFTALTVMWNYQAARRFLCLASEYSFAGGFEHMKKSGSIPIATLSAVSSLVQQTGPLLKMAAEQRVEARKARAEVLRARAADRDARNDAKALRRAEQARSVSVTRIKHRPVKVSKKILVVEEEE